LNNTLTVNAEQPNSHANFGWNQFTDNIIRYLDENVPNVIFILLGNFAKSKRILIRSGLVVEAPHPSPLSAHTGFFGSKIFSRVNKILTAQNRQPINW
jgi:uracil-DNA glycosylase